ncbi:MAG: 16S rRNA (uracil(1498)-N(3))-methyltransferase [Phycisphaera sp.]|nr:MAG: 16S rRNA (uracil(1498)-N(3))-methyltransferase [Phycisphaera sp.]
MHHLIVDTLDPAQTEMAIEGEQARHAIRVRRMESGEPLILMDGAGRTAEAVIDGTDKNGPQHSWRLLVGITRHREHPRPSPEVNILCPAPKGDLMETMIDELSQAGAASWRPLETQRTERQPKQAKMDRLARITREAAKQCGRPWYLELADGVAFEDAITLPGAVLADAGGATPTRVLADAPSETWSRGIHVLVGPEGGFSDQERSMARDAGLATVGLGPHVLRIGTASVVAASGFVMAARESW